MTILTICPACEKHVGLPSETRDTAQVRCPLCNDEFALANAFPADTPLLEVIDPGAPDLASDAGEGDSGEAFDLSIGSALAEPSEGAPETGVDLAEATEGDATPAADTATAEGDEAADAEGFNLNFEEFQPTESPFASDESSEGGDEFSLVAGDSDDAVPNFESPETADAGEDGGVATASATAKLKAPTKKPAKRLGWKSQMAGIVIFGFIGLALGYGILKIIKPAATAPIDKQVAKVWTSVSSLWSSETAEEGTSDGEGGTDKSGKGAGGGDFVIGGMLPDGQQPKGLDPATVTGVTSGKSAGPDDWMPDDDAAANGGPAVEPPTATGPFAALLRGQPDTWEVMDSVTPDQLSTALEDVLALGAVSQGKLTPDLYFGMCKLGHAVSFAKTDADGQSQQLRSDAADAVRQIATSALQPKLSSYSVQMLFSDKRPKDQKGIFLVGKVQLIAAYGDLHATEMELNSGGDKRRIVVLTTERPKLNVHNVAGVLGSVVRDPQAKLPGYDPNDSAFERFKADGRLVVLAGAVARLAKK